MRRCPDLSLYLVLDRDLCQPRGLVATSVAAVAGGVRVVQLRDKQGGTERLVATGRALKAALDGSGAILIVNDDIEAALAIDADGLHVGQDDTNPAEARARIGASRLLGLSVETEPAARAANADLVDYVGAGPVFATPTKPDHKPAIGFDGLRRLVRASPVPAVAIGGLGSAHAADVLGAGATGLAVVSAICGQPDPQAAARAIRVALDRAPAGSAGADA